MWCFVAVFFVASLVLSLGVLIAGPSQAGANERLSKAPALFTDSGGRNFNYLSDAAGWMNDHFFLRQELITLDNLITGKMLHTSGTDNVILGSDNWLYYASTLDNYTGQNTMTDREIFSAATNLELIKNYCREQGREFLFVIAPNKNSLYGENMPNTGVSNPRQDANNLYDELSYRHINYVDFFALFDGQAEKLYFAHDSHWNSKGAALGADAINNGFGRTSHYAEDSFAETVPYQGDLYEMLYPSLNDPERDVVYGGKLNVTYTSSATKPDSIVLKTEGAGEGSLLAYRDSYGNLLYPYLADSFASAYFSRAVRYDLTQPGDFVLIELVERNLRYLITNLPIMPAQACQQMHPRMTSGTTSFTTGKGPEGYTQITGTLPTEPDTDSRVYIVCEEETYEAFLLSDNGYGATIPGEQKPMQLMFAQNGKVVLYNFETAN